MELGPGSKVLVYGAVGWTCFFCLQGALNWTRQNRPQYLFFVRYGQSRPTRHPQEAKIQQIRAKFDLAALQATLTCDKPTACSSLDDLDFTWVGQKRDLKALAPLLQSCKVFAVDLEAHSVFTYQAMPCLLQIAVDSRCFVVDLLALHDSISILKAPFENSNVLKLLHGSAADLKWLQQLDIYPVNVLDTCALAEEAVRVNKVKKPGLGALLKELCGVDSNKSLAASDWRMRPLSKEMLLYSILDVHYLQYIAMTLVELCLADQEQVAAAGTRADPSKADPACSVSERKQQGLEGTAEGPDAALAVQGGPEQGSGVPHTVEDRSNAENGLLENLVSMNRPPDGAVAPVHTGSIAVEGPHDDGTPASQIDRAASLELKTGPLDELHHPCSPSVAADASAAAVQQPRPSEGTAGASMQAACEVETADHEAQAQSSSPAGKESPVCEAANAPSQSEVQLGNLGTREEGSQAAATTAAEVPAVAVDKVDSTTAPSAKQKRPSTKEKKASKKQAEEATEEVHGTSLKRVWWKSCDRTLIIHHEPTVAEVAKAAMSRLVSKEVEFRSKGARKGSNSKAKDSTQPIQPMQSPTEAAMFRIVGAACYWRTAVAHFVDISPVMVLPDSLVNYILKHRPSGTLAVVRCMHRWVHSHQMKHAERFRLEAEATAAGAVDAASEGDAGGGEGMSTGAKGGNGKVQTWVSHDRNPFAWYLDHWTPGWATVLASPWLSWLLHCVYTGKTSLLPVQVERMIAQQEVKYRRPQGPSGQPAASKSSKKNQTPSQARNEKDSAKNGSQAASSPTEGQEEEPKGGAPAVKMTRDKIIGKFSKKKPAYSSCKMLSQEGEFLAACDLKKLVWYVNKGLGQWEPDLGPQSSQPTIRLNFQHRTTDQETGDGFYNEVKANECVGCGEAGHYLKYKIVPDCYRKHFPVNMKSHRSHDIVLLCIDCHEKAHTSAEALKRQLATSNSVPLQPTSMPIRSDPFLPTPPPEECCSSRDGDAEQDADSLSDAAASAADCRSGAPVDATALPIATDVSADCEAGAPADATAADATADTVGDSVPVRTPNQNQHPLQSVESAAAAPRSGESSLDSAESSPPPPASGCNSRHTEDGARERSAANTSEVVEAAEVNKGLNPVSREGNNGSTGASSVLYSAGELPADVVSQRMPSPAHVRRVALTLERQPNLPEERRKDLEAVVARYVHGPAAPSGQGLAPGDLEAALLAGLAKSKRNNAIARLMQAGRPAPSGYTLSHQDGRVSVISAPHHQGGHMWHGRKVVEKIVATYGKAGLQELQVEFRKRFVAAVQPKNLPSSWNIHHEAPREFGLHSIFNSESPDPTSMQPPQIFAQSSQQDEGVLASHHQEQQVITVASGSLH